MEKLGQNEIYSQLLGQHPILRTYKGDELINEYTPLYTPPSDWRDIRSDCPNNSIALYVGVKSDYSQYNNLGFTATCIGGYKVFIDGNQYGNIYASDSQCNIIWSQSGINTGNNIITPSVLKAHKIWIEPATEGNNITAFHCARVAGSGNEQQGVLWVHFNLSNVINISNLLNNDSNNLSGSLCEAITAKNNKITCSGAYCSFRQVFDLGYVAILEADTSEPKNLYQLLQNNNKLKDITLKNFRNKNDTTGGVSYGMFQDSNIENIKGNWICTPCSEMFYNCKKLKKLPLIDASQSKVMKDFLTNAIALEDTVLDVRNATGLKKIGCYGTSQYFMEGFKGLQVSNQAPFNDGTAPQINVSYTGMDRQALVQLFNDLPYNVGYTVVGSPTINNGVASGFSENDYVVTSGTIEAQDISELVVKIRINSSALGKQQWQGVLTSNFLINFYCGNNAFEYAQMYFNGMGDLSFNTLLYPDTDYWLKYINNGTTATVLYSTDGVNFIAGASKDTSLISVQSPNTIIYGTRGTQVFDGSIDFSNNNTYIKKNDVYWFRGQPAMTKTLSCVGCTGNQNKLTIVGSPTIQDSVVSGFSSSNYLELPSWKDEGNDIDMVISFTLPDSYPNYSRALNSFGNSANNTSYFSIPAYKGGLAFRINNNENISINYNLQNNILYKARLTRISGTYTLFLLNENETILGTSSLQSSFLLANGESAIMKIGYENRVFGAEFPGNIYLDNTYIKVNDELFFGREQYLLPEDKAIATNKGWTLTL